MRPHTHHPLACNQLLHLRTGTRLAVRVLRGRLWLTRTGDSTDHFVSAGETLALTPGPWLLQADSPQGAAYELLLEPGWTTDTLDAAYGIWMAAKRRITWRTKSFCMSS
jgi:Protein of unknown function (DUF2917)